MTISRGSSDRIIQYGREGTLLIVASAAPSWSDTAWAEFLKGSVEMERSMGGPALLVFGYCPDGVPSASQRRMNAETTRNSRLADRVALLTNSAGTRSTLNALQWVLRKRMAYMPFRPTEVVPALEWLSQVHHFDIAAAAQLADALIGAAHEAACRPRRR